MITLSKIKSSLIKASKRILKVEQYGVKTANECSSFGDDSSPVKDMIAVYCNTAENGEPVVIGYINSNQLAAIGEKRIYSLKADKSLSAYIWLKNNETLEINGSADNIVRYQKLDNALQAQKDLINAELTKIQAALLTVGGVYAKTDISIDTSASKVSEVKTS